MDVRPVELVAADGVVLRGERWCGDGTWHVLLHDEGEDLDVWRPLLSLVEERGRSALALDLRGHGGSDDGAWDPAVDLAAALAFVRAEGAVTVCVVAAGDSAPAALASDADVLVLLSPAPCELRAPGVPRLFLYGSWDERMDETVRALRAAAIGWAGAVAFPTREQGTALLAGEWASQALGQIASFVDEQTYIATPR